MKLLLKCIVYTNHGFIIWSNIAYLINFFVLIVVYLNKNY